MFITKHVRRKIIQYIFFNSENFNYDFAIELLRIFNLNKNKDLIQIEVYLEAIEY